MISDHFDTFSFKNNAKSMFELRNDGEQKGN